MFEAAFAGSNSDVSFDNMALAIAAFERKLITPGAFDAFMSGDVTALDDAQRRGLELFMDTGCITCHNGAAVGGGTFQKLGLVEAYVTADQGRFEVTGNESDRYVFKVPSLRNIEKTGPYFHDGSIATLDETVRLMARHQLGKALSDAEVTDMLAFLTSLTGSVDPSLLAPPSLPKSGPNTPKPDPT